MWCVAHSQCILTQGCLSPGAPRHCRYSPGSSHLFFTPLQPEFHFCAHRDELPAAPLCFRFSIENEVVCCVLSNFVVSFFLSCCWSITWRLSVPACRSRGLVLKCLCQQQQRHVTRVDSPEQVGPHTEGASVHLLSYLLIYTTCSLNDLLSYLLIYTTRSLNDPQPGGSDPKQGCDLDQPDMSPTPLAALCAGQFSLRLCEGSKAAFPGPGAVAISAEVLRRTRLHARRAGCSCTLAGGCCRVPSSLLSADCLGVLSALARGSAGSVACLLVTFSTGLTGY